MGKFVHLHGHTEYSLLDGLSKIKQLIRAAKEMDMPALAITDHGAMYGAVEFYIACVDAGIKPIIGCELYVAKRSHKDKEGKVDSEPFHLTVLAQDYQGYLNLMKLVSLAHLEGYYYRPRVDKQLLKEFHQGLIALSGCPAGEFIRSLKRGEFSEAEKIAKTYLEIFGESNFYFEVQNHEYDKLLEDSTLDPKVRQDLGQMKDLQEMTFKAVKLLSKKMGVLVVATNDYHYVNGGDAAAQDALVCIQTGKLLSDFNRLRMIDTPNLYLRSPEEMKELFLDLPEAVSNTMKVAKQTELEIPLGKSYFPVFDVPQNLSPMEYLKELCEEKLPQKFPKTDEKVRERLEYELSVIEKKGYATYFLVVYDFVDWAHQEGIITNTRGSAAGSLVLYILGVTNIDPLYYMLPFERFLNPYRPSLPDIDVDLADDRRDEVIRYVMDKYGHDKVAHITTFGTMMGRAAVRDIGRVLGMSYGEVDRIAKLIPPPHQGFHKPLSDAIKEVPELGQFYKDNLPIKQLLDLAKRVEGTVRHASVHAAGVVIAPTSLTDFTPLQKEANGDKIVTQYDMSSVGEEGVGLVKMDLLGLRNLSILGHAAKIIKENGGVEVDLHHLPLNDQKTFALLSRGETMGVFQLEGSGMTRYLMELKPTTIFDIMAMVALYRPGPLSIIPEYIARKHNPKKITYLDSRMTEYMERSLGLLVYQEDVMLTAINIAGYTWEEADKFRKAMGKKIPAEMAKQKDHFIEGCVTCGLKKKTAEELFKLIEAFAAYGFNKAHAASYAMVAYQTAYLKANYPVEFMAAVMTAEYGNTDKIAAAIEECRKLGMAVFPPDINKSQVGFTLEDLSSLTKEELNRQIGAAEGGGKQGVRFGLSAIKNVGISAIKSILEARDKDGFKSLLDLCLRVDNRLVNRKTLESLIKAGAMDTLGNRAAQLAVLDRCLELAHQKAKRFLSYQTSLFGENDTLMEAELKLPQVEEITLEQLLLFEKELLGFYLHRPSYWDVLKKAEGYYQLKISDLSSDFVGQSVTLGGVVVEVKRVFTKKSAAEMAFVKLSDGVAEIETVVFPSTYQSNKQYLRLDQVVVVKGRVDMREEQLSLVVLGVWLFDTEGKEEIKEDKVQPMEIYVPPGCGVEVLQQVNKLLREFPGKVRVSIFLPDNGGSDLKKMNLPFGVRADSSLVAALEELLGKGSTRLT